MEYCVVIRKNDIEFIWVNMEICLRCIVMLKKKVKLVNKKFKL